MFLSKAFSMSEMKIYQILRLNYYKKQKEWWTDDIDGDFISFNLYRYTETSIILLKRWRGDFRKEYCQIYQHCFYLEELTQKEWSISKNNKRMEKSMKQILKKNAKYRFVRLSFNRLSKFKKNSVCLYYHISERKQQKSTFW